MCVFSPFAVLLCIFDLKMKTCYSFFNIWMSASNFNIICNVFCIFLHFPDRTQLSTPISNRKTQPSVIIPRAAFFRFICILTKQRFLFAHAYARSSSTQRTVTRDWPPTVQVNSVISQSPLVISSTAKGERISISAVLYRNTFPSMSVKITSSPCGRSFSRPKWLR